MTTDETKRAAADRKSTDKEVVRAEDKVVKVLEDHQTKKDAVASGGLEGGPDILAHHVEEGRYATYPLGVMLREHGERMRVMRENGEEGTEEEGERYLPGALSMVVPVIVPMHANQRMVPKWMAGDLKFAYLPASEKLHLHGGAPLQDKNPGVVPPNLLEKAEHEHPPSAETKTRTSKK